MTLSGTLTYPEATAELRRRWTELMTAGERWFVINMLAVPWLDSSGMGEIVACYKRAHEQGGVVKLVLEKKPYTMFTHSQLGKMFGIFSTEEEAVAGFAGGDEPAR